MGSVNTCQKRMLKSVFVIVSITILMMTILATFFEKNRFQKQEMNRIYYETFGLKSWLGHLMFDSNWQNILKTLENAKAANQSILYFRLTDMNGAILVCDEEFQPGNNRFDPVTVIDVNQPVFERSDIDITNKIPSWFRIYKSKLNREIIVDGTIKAAKNEMVFDAFLDITYMGEKQGVLRVGFSRKGLKQHLAVLIGGILLAGCCILTATLVPIFIVVKKNLKPLDLFVSKLSDLRHAQGGGVMRERLSAIHWDETDSDIREIQRLKRAFLKIRDLFILNWDQLESHRQNLEIMVEERTRELRALNRKLTRQIEEKKDIEAKLINTQKLEAIGILAGGIAHEFNNLFMAITGYASLIQKHSGPDHPNTEKAEKIRDLVDSGSNSIRELMGFARVGKYASGPLNINEVLRKNLDIFKRSRKDITLVTKFSEDLWNVHADRSQLEQIFMNLLLNASDAMPGNGNITVETHNVMLEKKTIGVHKIVSGRFVHVSIQDQGKGIKQDHIQRVFDPFFTTKPFNTGSGLGLASVYGVVDNHGGFTTVESTEGKGSVFNVFLPAITDRAV